MLRRANVPIQNEDIMVASFLDYLQTEAGSSPYTLRNYRQALTEFINWYEVSKNQSPTWLRLKKTDFRAYLRFLGRGNLSRSAVQLRFSALRSFYKHLIRRGKLTASPIKGISLPKKEKRLPQFLTPDQMIALLEAPLRELQNMRKEDEEVDSVPYLRDAAILEVIYSCGLRISEMCSLRVMNIDFEERLIRVQGKGKKERQLPIGLPALRAIEGYWKALKHPPTGNMPAFLANPDSLTSIYPRIVQLRLKHYLQATELEDNVSEIGRAHV